MKKKINQDSSIEISSGTEKSSKKKRTRIIAVSVCVAVVAVGTAGFFIGRNVIRQKEEAALESSRLAKETAMHDLLDTDVFYDGIVVQGVELGGKSMPQAKEAVVEASAAQNKKFDIHITFESQSWQVTENDVGYSYNVEKILDEAYEYGRNGDLEQRYEQVNALKETPKQFNISTTPDFDSMKQKLDTIAAEIDKEPENAAVTGMDAASGKLTFKEGTKGRKADSEKLSAEVMKLAQASQSGTVPVTVNEEDFAVRAADLEKNMKKLGTGTSYSTNTENGTFNMARALNSINGTCIPAGGTFSFQGVVGNSDKANGYKLAGTIVGDKIEQNYGGGVCQAATTLYGAALRSNVKIVERHNHTIQSTYCAIGQDATVSDGGYDLKFQNTSPYPLYIVSGVTGRTLNIAFYGYQDPSYDEIKITSQLTKTQSCAPSTKYQENAGLAKGQIKTLTAGRDAKWAAAQRVYYKNGKVVKTEDLSNSYYPPSAPVVGYGPGTELKDGKPVLSSGSSSSSPSTPSSSTPSSSTPSSSTPSQGGGLDENGEQVVPD